MNDEDVRDLVAAVASLRRDLAALERKYNTTFVQGPVTDRDHDKGVRIARDPEGKHKSPWRQPADLSGRTRALPDKGENVLLLQPHGDPEQGIVIGLGHSKAKKNPAKDIDNTVLLNEGGVRIEKQGDAAIVTGKTIKFVAGGVTATLTADGLAVTGGKITHNGKDIGDTHRHGGVAKGGLQTDPPA